MKDRIQLTAILIKFIIIGVQGVHPDHVGVEDVKGSVA
jgi:hypothetical protein